MSARSPLLVPATSQPRPAGITALLPPTYYEAFVVGATVLRKVLCSIQGMLALHPRCAGALINIAEEPNGFLSLMVMLRPGLPSPVLMSRPCPLSHTPPSAHAVLR